MSKFHLDDLYTRTVDISYPPRTKAGNKLIHGYRVAMLAKWAPFHIAMDPRTGIETIIDRHGDMYQSQTGKDLRAVVREWNLASAKYLMTSEGAKENKTY